MFKEIKIRTEYFDKLNNPEIEIDNILREYFIKLESGATDAEFDEFWTLYDKKVGSRTKIKKKFKKLSKKKREAIMKHIVLYKKSQPDKQYRKNPDTYINNESWNDEIIINSNSDVSDAKEHIDSFFERFK